MNSTPNILSNVVNTTLLTLANTTGTTLPTTTVHGPQACALSVGSLSSFFNSIGSCIPSGAIGSIYQDTSNTVLFVLVAFFANYLILYACNRLRSSRS